jgi:hypothetical protein
MALSPIEPRARAARLKITGRKQGAVVTEGAGAMQPADGCRRILLLYLKYNQTTNNRGYRRVARKLRAVTD